jgi:hypothetical protein
MSVIATDTPYFSNVVKAELMPEVSFCRGVVVVNDTAATLKVGTVLGKVTATGKYKVAVQTASDGSNVPDAIVIRETIVPGSTDTNVVVLLNGPAAVSKSALILDATYNTDAELAAVYAALWAKQIKALTTVVL